MEGGRLIIFIVVYEIMNFFSIFVNNVIFIQVLLRYGVADAKLVCKFYQPNSPGQV